MLTAPASLLAVQYAGPRWLKHTEVRSRGFSVVTAEGTGDAENPSADNKRSGGDETDEDEAAPQQVQVELATSSDM